MSFVEMGRRYYRVIDAENLARAWVDESDLPPNQTEVTMWGKSASIARSTKNGVRTRKIPMVLDV